MFSPPNNLALSFYNYSIDSVQMELSKTAEVVNHPEYAEWQAFSVLFVSEKSVFLSSNKVPSKCI